MIKITIEITDSPLPSGQFYGRISAMPENVEPVNDHELQIRDLIMNTLQSMAKDFVQSEGISKSIIAKVPLKRRRYGNTGDTRENQGTVR
jgi:hypothetical protein